ncbi:acetate--CoA ligase family protein [Acidovorax sp. CCYZU-2555]|uniref:acetate--CoA ligase family protein n=1 Tax=Acidovorax sp. CCYZU-2555 TaxID=2835042 RepID=UPI001BD133C6|nr:acetate--CoA ligase family protein [Acidovorax sp. CCYZU-2555]MBS7780972.1 acetate--CoA ligase family protein [Acidovorax sp. CCYZU-2555]
MSAYQTPAPGAGMDAFFLPRGIAVIGASADATKIGGRPVHLLRRHGYAGAIYPINPKGGEIQGLPAYARLADTPQAPELALIAVPASHAVQAVEDCAARGVRAVVVLSSGFAEAGEEGAAWQAAMRATALRHGMRLLGPNCLGTVGVAERAIGSFSVALEDYYPQPGAIGIVSQSGNIGSYTLQLLVQRGVGISRMVTTGNEAEVDLADGIAALARDPATRVILCCMETCRDGARLTQALAIAREHQTPVVVLKIGATEQGQAAAASHTGALAASDAVIDAVLRRHGALRVRSHEDLVEIGQALSQLLPDSLPRKPAVTLVAASGGFGIMMADAMSNAGLALPALAAATRERIHKVLPGASTNNPVDASAQISSRPDILFEVLSALQEDPGEATTVLFLSLGLYSSRLRDIYLQALAQLRAAYPQRPLIIISRGPADAVMQIQALGIPVFSSIDAAARGIEALVRQAELLAAEAPAAAIAPGPAARLPEAAFRNEYAAKQALIDAGFEVPLERSVKDADAAVQAADALGYPVVLKILSEDIPHKTEAGGVALNLADAAAVRAASARIFASVAAHAPDARIEGLLVAPMLRGGTELIAGISRDPVFGPVVMVGMGGIYAEVLRDVAVQPAPVSQGQALAMIRSLRLFPLLDGARGQARADIDAAARAVARLSEFACTHRDQVGEIDLNPILVRPAGQGIAILDALMVALTPETESAHAE